MCTVYIYFGSPAWAETVLCRDKKDGQEIEMVPSVVATCVQARLRVRCTLDAV